MALMAANEAGPKTEAERFFAGPKLMTVNGYYNSAIGIHHELRYKGNRPQPEFRGWTHPEHEIRAGGGAHHLGKAARGWKGFSKASWPESTATR
ncbi:MAG: hypothetical protein LC130_27550 [Bryobacterales bacterium]|nr:hypothetical protein [Bryobacterales bacterium]MEB2364236.1 hypothetical protein [Bryobacterales bacterium]